MPLTPKPPYVNTVVTTRIHRGGEERATLGVVIDGKTICFELRYSEKVFDTELHKPQVETFPPILTFGIVISGVAVNF